MTFFIYYCLTNNCWFPCSWNSFTNQTILYCTKSYLLQHLCNLKSVFHFGSSYSAIIFYTVNHPQFEEALINQFQHILIKVVQKASNGLW